MRSTTLLFMAMGLLACPPTVTRSDGGLIDTSCGIDCEAQRHFGLMAGRCYAYSSSSSAAHTPADLAAIVKPVFTLENNISVMQVEYRIGGTIKMVDSFGLPNGQLWLMRREWPADGQSVSYKSDGTVLSGAQWLTQSSTAQDSYVTTTKADVILDRSSNRMVNDVSYRVTAATPSMSDLKTPKETYTEGLVMLFSESPGDNGTDPRRVFVPEVGFTVISTPLQRLNGIAVPRYLQAVTEATGTALNDCSL